MDATFINPFLEAAVHVLQTMAFPEMQVGHQFQAAIPTMIDGKGHTICHEPEK